MFKKFSKCFKRLFLRKKEKLYPPVPDFIPDKDHYEATDEGFNDYLIHNFIDTNLQDPQSLNNVRAFCEINYHGPAFDWRPEPWDDPLA